MDFALIKKKKTGLKTQTSLIAGLLLALSLPRCSALQKNFLSGEKARPLPENSFKNASRKLSAASPRLSRRGFSPAKSAFAEPKALDELYDRFVTEVDYEIRQGLAQKDQKRVLFALQNLQRMLPQTQEGRGFQASGPGKKEALTVFERLNALLDSNLMIFSEGNPSPARIDYLRAAEDYKSLMSGASKYAAASARHDEIFQSLLRRKSQTAGAGIVLGGFAAAAGIAALVTWLGMRGAEDERLIEVFAVLRKNLQACSNSALASAYAAYKKSGKIKGLNRRHQEVLRNLLFLRPSHSDRPAPEELFCSQSPQIIDNYEDFFGDVSRLWGRADLCESIGAPSKESCFLRNWLCENIRSLIGCLQEKNIQIEWLSPA